MKHIALLAGLLGTTPALAQTIVSVTPAPNMLAAPRATAVTATLSAPAGPGATAGLRVFSAQAGGRKSGTATTAGNVVTFTPTNAFKPGETVTATLSSGVAAPKVWQFTTAATGGTGTFTNGTVFAASAYPYGTILTNFGIADLNGDGNLDVAIGEIGTNPSSLVFNDGTGQLGRRLYISGASYTAKPFSFGDTDGDGDLDLGSALNSGTGVFTVAPGSSGAISGSTYGGWTIDVDGDGDLDYVYTDYLYPATLTQPRLRIALNDGAAFFTVTPTIVPLAADGIISTGDLDSDGDLDLINYAGPYGGSVEVLFNNGQGIFTAGPSYAASSSLRFGIKSRAAIGDVNGDGHLDIVTASYSGPAATILLNNGQGTFRAGADIAPNTYPGGVSASSVALGDVDGDGDLDALIGGQNVLLYRNNGSGTFGAAAIVLTNFYPDGGVALADMNNDGALDVVAAQPGSTNQPGTGSPGLLAIRFNGLATASRVGTAAAFNAWPNPVPAAAALRVSLAVPAVRASLSFTTVMGQVVHTRFFSGQTADVSTSGLAPGMYLLTIQADSEAPFTRRLTVE